LNDILLMKHAPNTVGSRFLSTLHWGREVILLADCASAKEFTIAPRDQSYDFLWGSTRSGGHLEEMPKNSFVLVNFR